MYRANPKTVGSGIVCCIPQTGRCQRECADCFFQSGRGYLDLDKDLPNMPDPATIKPWEVVRVNDGNDSNIKRRHVMDMTEVYPRRFYNTAISFRLEDFVEPVVMTVNPGAMTDVDFYTLGESSIPANLMFVRVRTNKWNLDSVVIPAVQHYARLGVPIVLTFMAYHDHSAIPNDHLGYYCRRKRTTNEYWAITPWAAREVMEKFAWSDKVYSCGKIEGIETSCKTCGNCLREYAATKERCI